MRIQSLKRLALAALIGAAALFSASAFAAVCEDSFKSAAEGSYHTNPDGSQGGFVAKTAYAASTAYVGPQARVLGNAQVLGNARVYGNAGVYGNAVVSGNARVRGYARVRGFANISSGIISEGVHE